MRNFDEYILDDGSNLNEQEKWVLEQIEKDELADLVVEFGINYRFRRLRATFLEKLLTDNFKEMKIGRKGILIENAIVIGTIDLEDAEIIHNVSLDGCFFLEKVNCVDSIFRKHLFLNRTIFVKDADFNGLEVKLNLFMSYSIFHGEADFSRMNIGGELIVFKGQFLSIENEADFSRIKVRQDVFFRQSKFNGHISFENAHFEKQFNVSEGQFLNDKTGLNFSGCKIDGNAVFVSTKFKGWIDFSLVEIRGQLNAEKAEFLNDKHSANFSNFIAERDTSFIKAKFYGPVDFINSEIGGDFYANGSEFSNINKVANFSNIKIDKDAFFYKAKFHGGVVFSGSEIMGSFYASEAEFLNKKKLASFDNMLINKSAYFYRTKYHCYIDFPATEVKKEFNADDAEFFRDADFESLTVGWIGFFRDTIFHKEASFTDANFMDLIIIGMECCPIISDLNLERCNVNRELRIRNVSIRKFKASYFNINGPATLKNLIIKNFIDLQESNFKALNLIKVKLFAKKSRVLLEGMKYHSINAGDQWGDWEKLLRFIEGSKYNTQAYTQLEEYFQRCGHKERADEVFISMKWNERKLLEYFPLRRIWNWILYTFVGYGRKPEKALLWSVLIICLGISIFYDSSSMVPKQRSNEAIFAISEKSDALIIESERNYDPILYSLDLFLPIDLEISKYWEPKSNCRLKRYYAKIQIIMGWVLITLLLASLTGIIK